MRTKLTEQLNTLDRITFLESIFTDQDTIKSINEAVSGENIIGAFKSASEMMKSLLDGEDSDEKVD